MIAYPSLAAAYSLGAFFAAVIGPVAFYVATIAAGEMKSRHPFRIGLIALVVAVIVVVAVGVLIYNGLWVDYTRQLPPR